MSNQTSLHDRINFRGTVDAWARYAVRDWQRELDAKLSKPANSNSLRNGIKYSLMFKGDELVNVHFQFPYYGRFVDMGVGKGVKIGDVGELKISRRLSGKQTGNRRKRKPWLNKKLAFNQHRLAEIMASHYGRAISSMITEGIVKID
jgi:hypothetical protein